MTSERSDPHVEDETASVAETSSSSAAETETDKPPTAGAGPDAAADGSAGPQDDQSGGTDDAGTDDPDAAGTGTDDPDAADAADAAGAEQSEANPAGEPAPEVESEALPPVAAEPESADRESAKPDSAKPESAGSESAGSEPVASRTPWVQVLGWSRSPAALLVGLLIGLLGFGLAVQVRSNTSTSGLPAARQEDLVRILDDISSREERLRRQIAELEAARTRLSTTGDSSSTALEEARKRSDALGILAGTVPAQGPGIRLTLTDPEHRLAAEDLLDTVEELRAAGAEAIEVGGVRIGLDSSFTSTDRGLAVDGVTVTAPYQIVAIGDPPTLATAMEIPGGVADTTQRAGGAARTEQVDRVVIRALRSVRTPRYSQPTN
jgi:uncharacterized protein YlxW (UPF0749 family)